MNMEEMLKKAQEAAETIQKQMGEAQAKLDTVEVEGVSGGGLVKIRATAKGRILVAAAFNDARTKADHAANAEMQKVQQGMGLPPGFNLPGMG